MRRVLLSISANQATAVWQHGRRTSACKRFDNEARGWQMFGLWLQQNPFPVSIIVDAVEEDYRSESLPHARGGTRKQLIERKLKQHFRSTPYLAAIAQGRESEGRRDDRYLFAALTNAELLDPWLDEIARREIPVCGVHLAPLIMVRIAALPAYRDRPLLIVTRQRNGLRQSFFEAGKLKLSRLTALDADDSAPVQTDEILKTRAYLTSLRLLPRDMQLDVLLLDSDGSLGELSRALDEDLGVKPERLAPAALARLLRAPPAQLASCAESLHFAIIGRGSEHANLAPASLRSLCRVHHARRALLALAAAIVAAASLLALAQLKQRSDLDSETAAASQQIRLEQARYQAAARAFPAAPAPAEILRGAVELSRDVALTMRTPELAFAVAASALERHPEIDIRKLDWTAREPTSGHQLLKLEGELARFDGDYRAALAKVERFATDLKTDARVKLVTIVKTPLDVSPGASLSGSAAGRSEPEAARFEIHIDIDGKHG